MYIYISPSIYREEMVCILELCAMNGIVSILR